ncbi:MAG: SDR family oxidoreductase [Alphaproteobacteria bacterium]|nr:SDR family oxidoreductase [Alphaproteobacteria bacterium]
MTGTLIVTGASRGIGAASARLAAKKLGCAVAVNYRKEKAAADKVVAEIVRNGGRAVAIQGDTGVEADIVRLFREAEQKLGPITGLVNNAGVLGPVGRVEDAPVKEMERLWAINITGYFVAAREAVKRMSTRHGGKGGAIVNITSAAVRLGAPGELVPYAASKGAAHSFTIGLGKEVAQEGIRVNGVEPGLIDTDIQPPGRVEKFGPAVPMGRAGTADEVAEAVVWLLSPASSYCTSSIITVSAGR